MDFHAAMETFAEAWVAANVHTAVNSDPGQVNFTPSDSELASLFKGCHGPVDMILYFMSHKLINYCHCFFV